MGTRHLIAVQIGGEYKVAQYGQWDGYPSGQGVEVLAFLRQQEKVAALREKAPHTRWLTAEERAATWVDVGADPNRDTVPISIANKHDVKYPHLSRDTGAGILAIVAEAEPGIGLDNAIDFAGDSLFCEWAYVVDLDANTLEVYRGFNKEPVSDGARFTTRTERANEYHPVRLVRAWKLDDLPSNESMVALESDGEDEDADT